MTAARVPSLKFGTHSSRSGRPRLSLPLTISVAMALNHPADASNSIFDLSLGEFLDRLGSADPTPGGGAAAAVVGALGAALIEMTANLTIGKPRLADVQVQAREIERRAAQLRQELGALADADAAAFNQVSAAYKLPRGDDAAKAARSKAIES